MPFPPPLDLTLPVACSLTASALGDRATQLRADLFTGALDRTETGHGYTFTFPGAVPWVERIHQVIREERACCPFLRFTVTFGQDAGPIWLNIEGPNGTKAFIETVFLARATDGGS